METNDVVGNMPIIVPTAETPLESPVPANVNPAETAETPRGHETVTETPKRVCAHCGREISDPHAVVCETHDGEIHMREKQTYKVRCAVTYACYAFVEAHDWNEAEKKAKKWFSEADAEAEASHVNMTYEVEECE